MWFIGVEVEQDRETSAPPPKKILDPPLSYLALICIPLKRTIPKKLSLYLIQRKLIVHFDAFVFVYIIKFNFVSSG